MKHFSYFHDLIQFTQSKDFQSLLSISRFAAHFPNAEIKLYIFAYISFNSNTLGSGGGVGLM